MPGKTAIELLLVTVQFLFNYQVVTSVTKGCDETVTAAFFFTN